MVKRIIFIFLISIVALEIVSCKGKEGYRFQIDNSKLCINDDMTIDLSSPIKKILAKLGNDYVQDSMPGYECYYLNNFPFALFVNDNTNSVDSVFFEYYDRKKNGIKEKEINQIILRDITITKNTSFEEMKKILESKTIMYEVDSRGEAHSIIVQNHKLLAIRYMNYDTTCPWAIEILVDSIKKEDKIIAEKYEKIESDKLLSACKINEKVNSQEELLMKVEKCLEMYKSWLDENWSNYKDWEAKKTEIINTDGEYVYNKVSSILYNNSDTIRGYLVNKVKKVFEYNEPFLLVNFVQNNNSYKIEEVKLNSYGWEQGIGPYYSIKVKLSSSLTSDKIKINYSFVDVEGKESVKQELKIFDFNKTSDTTYETQIAASVTETSIISRLKEIRFY